MATDIINKIEREQMKKEVTPFHIGDSVKVHCRVVEGGKERIQIFQGIVIGRRGALVNESFTVRKISSGEGVERTFPLHSPKVANVEVLKKGKVRRARLNYLRERIGKGATTVKEATSRPKGSLVGSGVAAAAEIEEAAAAQAAAVEAEAAAKEAPAEQPASEEPAVEAAGSGEPAAEEKPAE